MAIVLGRKGGGPGGGGSLPDPTGEPDGDVLTVSGGAAVWSPGGGSRPTDTPIFFEEIDGAVSSYPILAVDLGAQTIEIAGDHADEFNFNMARITGSTGNDGDYDLGDLAGDSSTYAAGPNRTTVDFSLSATPFVDDTVDGNLEAPVIYAATVEITNNSAIEWIAILTTAEWGIFDKVFPRIGDDSDDTFFMLPGDYVGGIGLWQWPMITLAGQGVETGEPAGSGFPVYTLYPNGTTVSVKLAALNSGAETGRTTIIVHHHETEVGDVPTRTPVA